MPDDGSFTFPAHIPLETAQQLLAEAYEKVNAGKVVRRTTKRARKEGHDPPMNIGYVAEPAVVEYPDGLGVSLGADILLYDEFPGFRRCLAIFEEEVGDQLMKKLEKLVKKWVKKNPGPKG